MDNVGHKKKFWSSSNNPLTDLTVKQLKQLVNDEYCCVEKQRHKIHVSLPPSSIGKEGKYVLDYLNSLRWHYLHCAQGFVLGFENVVFETSAGTIMSDNPFIHEDIEADFYVFNPKVGSLLKGKINRITPGHIGCLVHDFFNVSIHLPRPVPADLNPYLKFGENVIFEVKALQLKNQFLRVNCEFTRDSITQMQRLMPRQELTSQKTDSLSEAGVDDDSEHICASEELFETDGANHSETSETSKKKRKKKHKDNGDQDLLSPPTKKHKRKKHSHTDWDSRDVISTDDSGLASSPLSLQSTNVEEHVEVEVKSSHKKNKERKKSIMKQSSK